VASDLQPFQALAPESESADCFGPLAGQLSAVYRYLAGPGSALPPRERACIPPEEAREEKAKEAWAGWGRPRGEATSHRACPAPPSVARNGWTGGLRTNCLIAGVPAWCVRACLLLQIAVAIQSRLALHCIAGSHEAEMMAD
jgi:hypothetical protein